MGGGSGTTVPSSGEASQFDAFSFSILMSIRLLWTRPFCVCVCVCAVRWWSWILSLKTMQSFRNPPRWESMWGNSLICPITDSWIIIICILDYSSCLVWLHTAAAHPHSASWGGAGLVRWSPLHLLCGPWGPRGQPRGAETRGRAPGGEYSHTQTNTNLGLIWLRFDDVDAEAVKVSH